MRGRGRLLQRAGRRCLGVVRSGRLPGGHPGVQVAQQRYAQPGPGHPWTAPRHACLTPQRPGRTRFEPLAQLMDRTIPGRCPAALTVHSGTAIRPAPG